MTAPVRSAGLTKPSLILTNPEFRFKPQHSPPMTGPVRSTGGWLSSSTFTFCSSSLSLSRYICMCVCVCEYTSIYIFIWQCIYISLGISNSTLWYSVPVGCSHNFYIDGTAAVATYHNHGLGLGIINPLYQLHASGIFQAHLQKNKRFILTGSNLLQQ